MTLLEMSRENTIWVVLPEKEKCSKRAIFEKSILRRTGKSHIEIFVDGEANGNIAIKSWIAKDILPNYW
jgi:hypothetical protein